VVGKTTLPVVGKVDDPEFLLLVVNPLLKVSPALLVVVGKVDHLVVV
jgi:hypothetical protein